MNKNPANTGFTNVDHTKDPQHFVDCLADQYAKNSVLRGNKQRTLQLADIQPGHVVLDAGCGIGNDAAQMAELVGASGHVFGIDSSQKMIDTAVINMADSGLPLTFRQGSIYQLDFADNFFDRCRADKTFQHLADPKEALQEVMRVTKPGGKIIIADPDHDSLIIDTPFSEINRRFTQFRSSHITQGGIAHQLYGLCKELGLVDITVHPLTNAYTNYAEKVSSPYLDEIWMAQKQGAVTEEEAEKWAGYLREAIENGRFLCMQTYVVTTAVKT